jgi:hypothetical protein
MQRHWIVISGLLLWGFPTLVGCWGASAAELQPVQYVYPDSTLAEIQQALDDGGTVYFDSLTKQSRQYAEYNQVARSAPDLPPTPNDPAKGFNVGAKGKDVNIIGLLGPNGERPRINGGTVMFRVGRWPVFGFLGLPINFRIENLELFNPDLGPQAMLYSRIGISINYLGAQSTINNCKITITGKEGDPGHSLNHSVGIWFYLVNTQPQAPPNGAVIQVINNTIVATRAHEGLHVDSFWPVVPGFTPPRAVIANNSVDVRSLGGYPNGLGTNGATIASAIILEGNLPNSVVASNIITGDARMPIALPKVEAVGLYVAAITPKDTVNNITVAGNDSSGFTGDFQMRIDGPVADSTVTRNSFGPASTAGVKCAGHDITFVNNLFSGSYPGWAAAGGRGLFWFTASSRANRVEATRLLGPLQGPDICGQMRDEAGGANQLRGYDRCR